MTVSESIAAYVAAQNANDDIIDAAVTGIQGDVKFLNDTIATLQNSPGTLTPADQASLDALQARGKVIADKLTALDALTTPPPPPGCACLNASNVPAWPDATPGRVT